MAISRLIELDCGILVAGPPKPCTDTASAPRQRENKASPSFIIVVLSPKALSYVVSKARVERPPGSGTWRSDEVVDMMIPGWMR